MCTDLEMGESPFVTIDFNEVMLSQEIVLAYAPYALAHVTFLLAHQAWRWWPEPRSRQGYRCYQSLSIYGVLPRRHCITGLSASG
jgi:hypothetical protein